MMAHPPRAAAIDAGATIDRGVCGPYQIALVFLTALTLIFDGVDNQLLGIVIPSVMRDCGVARSAFAPVVALGFLGMMIVGLVAGLAGDRFGRKTALFGSMVLFVPSCLQAVGPCSAIAKAVD